MRMQHSVGKVVVSKSALHVCLVHQRAPQGTVFAIESPYLYSTDSNLIFEFLFKNYVKKANSHPFNLI